MHAATPTATPMMKEVTPHQRHKLAVAKAFTEAYRAHLDAPVAVREAMCLKAYYPAMCDTIRDGDLIAGRMIYNPLVGFGLEIMENKGLPVIARDSIRDCDLTEHDKELRRKLSYSSCGFCWSYHGLTQIAESLPRDDPQRGQIEDMICFWSEHATSRKYNDAVPDAISQNLGRTRGMELRYANSFFRLCCFSVKFDTLLRLGVPGMRQRIADQQTRGADGDSRLYEGMLIALDVLVEVCDHYARQAAALARECDDAERKDQLLRMAEVLDAIQGRAPQSLHEAAQLFWIYSLLTDCPNYGRMDVYLGDFYARDIDSGVLAEEQALELLASLWRLIGDIHPAGGPAKPNTRIILGGLGRRNEDNADRFALAAMEVSRRVRLTEPNVTLRFHKGQNPALMEKALDLLGEGCIHPGLYCDDSYLDSVARAYDAPRCDAEQYVPEGCGEILLDGMAVGSPNSMICFVSALDLVLHNGFDTMLGERRGLELGTLDEFDTFEKLVNAFKAQVELTYDIFARRHAIEHDVKAEHVSFLYLSMLTDDCIDRGRSLYDGGVKYRGGIVETFGLTNLADSLYAIRELVYDRKVMSLAQLVEVLDADFEGYEAQRRLMLNLPKFGNDHEEVDALHTELSAFVNRAAFTAGRRAGLDFFLNCNLNPGGGYYRMTTKASADGRRCGESMAYGNAPTAGRDRQGVTALLNSMAKHDKLHLGYVHNLKLSKSLFSPQNRPKLESLLGAYFDSGGIQAMVTALDRDDLVRAQENPEQYANLLVRVAGWTSRFVELPRHDQIEVMNRTFYE